ncbi:MAG: hypothetical protein GY953_13585, partial [bacterium]|nr:hypothetical protein [bacterium]
MKSEITRRALLRLTAGAAALSGHAASSGTLALTLVDEESGTTVPARVLLRDAEGTDHVPDSAAPLPIGPDRWFLSTGEERLTLPEGEFDLRVERGTEYVPVKRRISVFGSKTEQQVSLRRWVNMRQRGYVSGENHLHVPASSLPAMLAGEDLDFGSSLYWWNGPDLD